MRRVGIGDLVYAARAVQDAPAGARHARCRALVWRAHAADKYVKRLRKLHPEWGDGSLRGAVAAGGVVPPPLAGMDLCHALAVVLEVLTADMAAKSGRL